MTGLIRQIPGTLCVLTLLVAGCRPSPHVGSSSDDDKVAEIGFWEQQPSQFARDFCVRPPGQEYGAGDGSSWGDALSGLPEALVRGARYYLAAGDYYDGPPADRYHSHVLDDPEDGDLAIGIYKATVAEHGDATDWEDSFADGAVRLGPVAIATGYYHLDGREGAHDGSYGMEIHTRDCARRAEAAAGSPLAFPVHSDVSHVSLQQLDIADCGSQDDPALPPQDTVAALAPVSALTLRDCHLGDAWRSLLRLEEAFDVLLERNHFARAGHHAEASAIVLRQARNVVIRRNTFTDVDGAFVILAGVRNVLFSANVLQRQSEGYDLTDALASDGSALSVLIMGNTFFNLTGLNAGVRFAGHTGGLRLVNNLWAGCRADELQLPGDHDHNAFYDNRQPGGDSLDAPLDEPTAQLLEADPFLDAAAFDLRLAVPTEPGASVLEPFVGVDYLGFNRGLDGVWDRGAYEHTLVD